MSEMKQDELAQKNDTPRRVMIGTPTMDGKVESWYTNSLVNTVKLAALSNIDLYVFFIAYDALVQRARNDIMAAAVSAKVDDLIFIDADILWDPIDFMKLLNHPVDMVGGTYRKKTDEIEGYPITLKGNQNSLVIGTTGLAEVGGLGTGFLRLSKNCIKILWDNAVAYSGDASTNPSRLVFNVYIDSTGALVGEDIAMCRKWIEMGHKVYLDVNITCGHVGIKKFTGNFNEWLMKQAQIQNNTTKGSVLL